MDLDRLERQKIKSDREEKWRRETGRLLGVTI